MFLVFSLDNSIHQWFVENKQEIESNYSIQENITNAFFFLSGILAFYLEKGKKKVYTNEKKKSKSNFKNFTGMNNYRQCIPISVLVFLSYISIV